jgi:hypothetical protein
MPYLIAGIAVLVVALVLSRAFVAADPRALARGIRYGLGAVLIGAGAFFILAERWGFALPLIAAGLSAIFAGRVGPFDLGGSRRSAGTGSTVRSAYLEMRLDHDSGAMSGRVLKGRFADLPLEDLDEGQLVTLHGEVAVDAESRALLEAYLDRRIAGWREHVERDAAAGTGRTADPGAMTDEEAYEVLGLAAGASDGEIRAAHRRLMMLMHPDRGGTTFLAAKINEAKDRLLGKHR